MENQILELTIDDMNSKGQGVAHHNGLAIFLDNALPGEKVVAKILYSKKSYSVAQVIDIKESCEKRVVPKCPHFRSCGGCQLQHMNMKGQIEYKRARINNALKRIANCQDHGIEKVKTSPKVFYYRNKVQLPVKMGLNGPCLGFYKRASHEIVEVKECYLHLGLIKPLFDVINKTLSSSSISVYIEKSQTGILRQVFIRSTENSGESVLCFVVTKFSPELLILARAISMNQPTLKGVCYQVFKKPTNAVIFSNVVSILGQSFVMEEILGLKVKLSVGAFFQVNTLQAQNVYNAILEYGGFSESQIVLDAYCGIGVLTLLIAKRVKKVIGIECVESAIADAKENMKLNGIENVEFKVGLSEKLINTIGKVDCAYLNPPRKGCCEKLLIRLAKMGVKRIIYMSCDPASLARDLKLLRELGYEISKIEGFDMFSQTTHVETLMFLTKSS